MQNKLRCHKSDNQDQGENGSKASLSLHGQNQRGAKHQLGMCKNKTRINKARLNTMQGQHW